MTPGRKFCHTTSACATRSRNTSRPSGLVRSSATDFLLRLMARKYADSPPARKGGPISRMASPPPGSSILITSAPMSASSMEPYGPASIRERSSTRIPSKSFIRSGPLPPCTPFPAEVARDAASNGPRTSQRASCPPCVLAGRRENDVALLQDHEHIVTLFHAESIPHLFGDHEPTVAAESYRSVAS